MKYNTLSQERQNEVFENSRLDIDERDNIIFMSTREIVPEERLITYFVMKGI